LNADGIPSPKGGLWTRQSVRKILSIRTYAGVASWGSYETEGAHPAIVSPSDWGAVQREPTTPPQNGNSLLGGLVRCAGCGYVMGAGDNGRGARRYNCTRHHTEMRCPSPTTAPADRLEELVTDEFLAHYGRTGMRGATHVDPHVSESEGVLEARRAEYAAWRDDTTMRVELGNADYRAGLLARKQAVGRAERAYGDAIRQAKSDGLSVTEDLWSTLTVLERRELMRAGIDAIVLHRAASTHTPLMDRVELLWAGELEHDGSRAGIAAAVRGRP
jgi:hypothetical protein